MALSPQQIAQLAYNAGFRGKDLRWAVAIALAESSGDPRAYNPELSAGTKKGSGSRGLWQIYGTAHPEYNTDAIYDPQLNANAAYKVYREVGGRFTPWSTYNNGMAAKIARSLNLNTDTSTLNQSAPLQLSALGGGLAQIGGGGIVSPQMLMNTTNFAANASKSDKSILGSIQLFPDKVNKALNDPDLPKAIALSVIGLLLIIAGLFLIVKQIGGEATEATVAATEIAAKVLI